jgi:uncharacterized protein YqhQ
MSSSLAGSSPTSPAEQETIPTAPNGAAPAEAQSAPAPGPLAPDVGPDGELRAQRDAPVGGQAVLEGVMMRGVAHWAVAVRTPSEAQLESADYMPGQAAEGEIQITTFPLTSALRRHRILRLPIVRGVVALGGSLLVGFRALEISANAQLAGEPPAQSELDRNRAEAPAEGEEPEQDGISSGVWVGTIVVAVALAIGLFFVIPVALTSLVKHQLGSPVLFWVVEGVLRTSIFLGYLFLLSRVHSLRRVFEYHGAEHKTISCFEAGLALTPANCQRFSRLHPRCGTSFLLVVMIVAIFVFAPLGLPAWYWLLLTRILGVPLIAGISFELIKFAGRNRRRRWVRAVMWPGLKLQLLTTREPDLEELAVAIASLEAVLALEPPGALSAADMVGVEVVA